MGGGIRRCPRLAWRDSARRGRRESRPVWGNDFRRGASAQCRRRTKEIRSNWGVYMAPPEIKTATIVSKMTPAKVNILLAMMSEYSRTFSSSSHSEVSPVIRWEVWAKRFSAIFKISTDHQSKRTVPQLITKMAQHQFLSLLPYCIVLSARLTSDPAKQSVQLSFARRKQ